MFLLYEKRHPMAKDLFQEHPGDAGFDLYAAEITLDSPERLWFDTGIAVEIPPDYFGLVVPRSSLTSKSLVLANSAGVIDSGYRGTIQVRFNRLVSHLNEYQVGDRIAQLIIVPIPHITPALVNRLSKSARGEGGFGSTGNR